MKRNIWVVFGVMAFVSPVHAEDLLDWLQNQASQIQHTSNTVKLKDNAELLTLEPDENEMYPKVSPDGRTMLVVSGKRRKATITLRLVENGDPLNVVSENDELALTSYAWHGQNHVSFLSRRAGGLGVWEKPVGGQGAIRRLFRLIGDVVDPVVLDDGSLIAVRLFTVSNQQHKAAKPDGFLNWNVSGKQDHLVHISREGAENDLAAGINPAVSPDGRQLVFSMRAGRSRHLFMMNVDGSDLVQLTDERSIDVQPAWSPDSKWIVFTSNRGRADMRQQKKSNWDIWAVARNGRNLTQLTYNKARDGAPNVGMDGRVYFHSDRKVGSDEQELHQVRGSTSGFHIWSVNLPAGLR
jgi:dipeptidyl aminopeptidase/acylaminoacyl peptidase